jgi:ClpP class serine protease
VQVDTHQILEALGPHAALDASLVGPFLARASGTVSTPKGMPLYDVDGSTAIITIEGALARKADFFWGILWLDGYDRIVQAIDKASRDPDIDSVLLRLDSPGGQATGLGEAAREMRAALDASGKPSVASVALGASAGYWLAAVADELYVEPDGAAGSIGTYTSHYDLSRALDKAGVTITRIQDPDGKTSGDWIKPLDDEGRTRLQEVVSMLSQSFYEHVSGRRNITPAAVRGLNARVFYGQKAVESKLADGVLSFAAAKKRAQEMAQKRKKEKMSDLASFLGLDPKASAEEIKTAADEAKPLLGLGRKALVLTGEPNADAASGVLVAWKKDAGEAATFRANAAQMAKDNDAKERHQLLIALAQVEPPSHVWADTRDLSKGPVPELAEMSTPALRSYVDRRTKAPKPVATRQVDASNANEPTEAEIKAYAKAHGIKNLEIARQALVAQYAEGNS